MPFADVAGIVAGLGVVLSDGLEGFVERDPVAPTSGLGRVETCL